MYSVRSFLCRVVVLISMSETITHIQKLDSDIALNFMPWEARNKFEPSTKIALCEQIRAAEGFCIVDTKAILLRFDSQGPNIVVQAKCLKNASCIAT